MFELLNSPLNHSHDRVFYIGFYGGEPLLNFPFIREIVDFALQAKVVHNRFSFNMTTNGLLLEKYMDFLAQHDFMLLISLDGNEYNNSYRVFKEGAPAYPQVLKNIAALQTKYPRYFETNVNFNVVFHNRNSVADVHRFFKTRFNKVPGLSELNPLGVSAPMRGEFRKTYANIEEILFQVEDYSLAEVSLYVNSECSLDCEMCASAYRQFLCCTRPPHGKRGKRTGHLSREEFIPGIAGGVVGEGQYPGRRYF